MENSLGNLNSDAFMARIFRSSFKKYFEVDHSYVLKKFKFLLFPFSFTKKNSLGSFGGTRDDIAPEMGNAPAQDTFLDADLYIPFMCFVTYVLLASIRVGVKATKKYLFYYKK